MIITFMEQELLKREQSNKELKAVYLKNSEKMEKIKRENIVLAQ